MQKKEENTYLDSAANLYNRRYLDKQLQIDIEDVFYLNRVLSLIFQKNQR